MIFINHFLLSQIILFLLKYSVSCSVVTLKNNDNNTSIVLPINTINSNYTVNDTNLQLSFTRRLQQSNRTRFNETRSSFALLRDRERSKQERILHIQSTILSQLGVYQRNNSLASNLTTKDRQLLTEIYGKLSNNQENGKNLLNENNPNVDIVFRKLQTFYPSCKIPSQIDHNRWYQQSNNEMRLFFDLNLSKSGNTQTEIVAILGKLMIFYSQLFVESSTTSGSILNANIINSSSSNNELNITVYQYLKPLKKNRKEKRKRIDRKSILKSYQGWIDFEISSCLLYWHQHPTKNYGLLIELTPAFDVQSNFQNLNCSDEQAGRNKTDSHHFLLDLVIVEARPKKLINS